MSDVLGFTAKVDTKKNEVGEYFNSLGVKLEEATKELEEVAKKSETDTNKGDLSKNPIREAINVAKGILGTLKGHLESLKGIGDGTIVGEAASDAQGTTPADDELKKAFKSLQAIVKVATDVGIAKLIEGSTTLKVDNVDNKDGAKILATSAGKPEAGDAGKAAMILATVSGEEMLASIILSKESDAALNNAASGLTTAMNFARGGSAAHLAGADAAKAAAVAGGIALRSLVKTGKLASAAAGQGGQGEVQKVGLIAANKLLVAVEEIIKKAVKNVIGEAKGKIDKAREPKAVGQQ
ncbi:variable large protein 7 (plasmid) [Borrelia crocidurae str. Achema]|uniref:Variable large protein n=2 Tax=Borrelia crocidurae TaxID=29520 RepID=I0FF11_BORCA|nr:variable large protein 7 [Borrelia crocidurae str. Achema]